MYEKEILRYKERLNELEFYKARTEVSYCSHSQPEQRSVRVTVATTPRTEVSYCSHSGQVRGQLL